MEKNISRLPLYRFLFYKTVAKIRRKIFNQQLPSYNSFASHIPVLIGIGKIIQPKSVLELGPGLFSTPLFVNPVFFPNVSHITCVESEKDWYEKVQSNFIGKDMVELVFAEPNVSNYVSSIETSFDLIFIDDSLTTEERASTIKKVAQMKDLNNTVVVIHDFEVPEYQQASRLFEHRYIFQCFNPNIGVVYNGNVLSTEQLMQLEKKIYKKRWTCSVTVFENWATIF